MCDYYTTDKETRVTFYMTLSKFIYRATDVLETSLTPVMVSRMQLTLKYSYCRTLVLEALGQSNWRRHPIAFRLLARQVRTGWSDPMHVAENEDKKRRHCTCAAYLSLEYAPI